MNEIPENEIANLMQEYPHLKSYVSEINVKIGNPKFYFSLSKDLEQKKYLNIIYTTKEPVFIHVYRTEDMEERIYKSIEPSLEGESAEKYYSLLDLILQKIPEKKSVVTDSQLKEVFTELIDETVSVSKSKVKNSLKNKFFSIKNDTISATPYEKECMLYTLIKEQIGGGPLEPLLRDPYLEDIHIVSGDPIYTVHKVFGMTKTNIILNEEEGFLFTRKLSEKMGAPVSEAQAIVDGVMPDGSRGNIIYPKSVSLKGPSITIRKFAETPISITQLISWGTLSTDIAAYLWLSLQYGRSFFVCGETASGKTTTCNAAIPFIPPDKKIYTAENTPELHVPHTVWQQLLTRTSDTDEGSVDLFDLLKAALRSRPDYIIPGETRGAEGNVVFQAMQTGHPCITTFHAGSVTKVIQRFTGDPINVPKSFMDNLDFVLIQMAVERKGKMLRRVLSVDEIEGYNSAVDGVMSRRAFEWNAPDDKHLFRANRNSFILEERIAKNAGYNDTSEIYEEFDRRKAILKAMIDENIFDYYEVLQFIWTFYREGEEGLPIMI